MTTEEAIEKAFAGNSVRLPEWAGYWFAENNTLKVFTKKGEIVDTPYVNSYHGRTDWEIHPGTYTFGEALEFMKNGWVMARKNFGLSHGQIRMVPGRLKERLIGNILGLPYSLFTVNEFCHEQTFPHLVQVLSSKISNPAWIPSTMDMLADDWYLVKKID